MMKCSICHNEENNKLLLVKEMLLCTRATFDYIECSHCHCLQLINPPDNMGIYYNNESYGSFIKQSSSPLKKLFRRMRNKYAIRGKGGVLGKFLFALHPIPIDFRIIGKYALPQSSILDVGCGRGNYINDLFEIGYKNVEGIDPFLEIDGKHDGCVRVRKLYVEEVQEKYDLVISHHSLEHTPDPLRSLTGMKNCMKDNGVLILTVPVAEELYRMFKESCYLIQAPQHFFLFSLQSIKILAEKAGLIVLNTVREADTNYDWYKISYIWSQDKTLPEIDNCIDSNIPSDKIEAFKRIIVNYKENKLGDNVIFVMKKNSYYSD